MSDNIRLARHECKASRAVFDAIAVKSLAPCGANRPNARLSSCRRHFNSLAPCGANPTNCVYVADLCLFQLTRPVRGEPMAISPNLTDDKISTHSPRAGQTFLSLSVMLGSLNFNSLAPCGANLIVKQKGLDTSEVHFFNARGKSPVTSTFIGTPSILGSHTRKSFPQLPNERASPQRGKALSKARNIVLSLYSCP